MTGPWPQLPIGDLCRLINGRAFKPSDWAASGVQIVRIQNLNDHDKPFNFYDGRVDAKHLVNSGDVLLSWSGTPGTSFGCFIWERGPGILNQHIFRVEVDTTKMLKEFFVHAVNERLEEMIGLAHGGVGLRHITKGKLEAIRVGVPALDVQRHIVARMQDVLKRAREIRRLRSENEATSGALLPALLKEQFVGLDTKYSVAPLEQVSLESRYGTSEKCEASYAGTPVLRIPNVAGRRCNFANLKFLARRIPAEDALLLRAGDLLIVRTNGSPTLVGRCAVVPSLDRPYGYASYLIRFRLDHKKARPKYVSYYLSSTYGRDQIAKLRRTSAGQYNINSESLRSIVIPLPPLKVQDTMVARMDRMDAWVLDIQTRLIAEKHKDSLLAGAVLRKAFAGEL